MINVCMKLTFSFHLANCNSMSMKITIIIPKISVSVAGLFRKPLKLFSEIEICLHHFQPDHVFLRQMWLLFNPKTLLNYYRKRIINDWRVYLVRKKLWLMPKKRTSNSVAMGAYSPFMFEKDMLLLHKEIVTWHGSCGCDSFLVCPEYVMFISFRVM